MDQQSHHTEFQTLDQLLDDLRSDTTSYTVTNVPEIPVQQLEEVQQQSQISTQANTIQQYIDRKIDEQLVITEQYFEDRLSQINCQNDEILKKKKPFEVIYIVEDQNVKKYQSKKK